MFLAHICSKGFKWNSGGKGRYTVASPEAESVGDNDTLPTVPETVSLPMFQGNVASASAAATATVPLSGEMLEAARVAAEGNVSDPNASAQAIVPNALAGLVTSGLVTVPQVNSNFMSFIGNGVQQQQQPQQQAVGINQQAQAFNYAQQLNLLRYQQLAQAQQQQQQQQAQNNIMAANSNGGSPFVNMPQPPPSS